MSKRVARLADRLGWPRIAPGVLAYSVLVAVGLADGGVFVRTWRLGAFALFAVAAAALIGRVRIVVRPVELTAVAALAAYTVWIGMSVLWSGNFSQAERALLYVACLLATLLVTDERTVRHLLSGVLAGVTTVAAYGLGIYLFTSPPLDPFEGALLYQPLGYANALGMFVAIGLLLSCGLAWSARGRAARAAALAPSVLLIPALLLTSSRGAWIALAVGLAALGLLGAERVDRRALALVAAATAAVGVAVAAVTGRGSLVGNRLRYWDVAWADFRDHPLLGSGAGTFGDYWLTHGPGPDFTRTAHSLYVQSLAELGPMGLLLVLAVVAVPLLAVRRRDRLVAAAAAPYVAYVLHTGVDWDWEMPAVTLAGIFCGGALLVATRPPEARSLTRRERLLLAAASLVLGAFALISERVGVSDPFESL